MVHHADDVLQLGSVAVACTGKCVDLAPVRVSTTYYPPCELLICDEEDRIDRGVNAICTERKEILVLQLLVHVHGQAVSII